MDHETARRIEGILVDCSKRVDETARLVREHCEAEEFKAYRKAAAQAMGALLDLREPIYREHPDL
jgi:hypothetical protein